MFFLLINTFLKAFSWLSIKLNINLKRVLILYKCYTCVCNMTKFDFGEGVCEFNYFFKILNTEEKNSKNKVENKKKSI